MDLWRRCAAILMGFQRGLRVKILCELLSLRQNYQKDEEFS